MKVSKRNVLDVVLVSAAIGLIAAMVLVNDFLHQENWPLMRARWGMRSVETAVTIFYMNHDRYPSTLEELTKPDPVTNKPLLTERDLLDGWHRPFGYDPTRLNHENGKPLIWSNGPQGEHKPITNWEMAK